MDAAEQEAGEAGESRLLCMETPIHETDPHLDHQNSLAAEGHDAERSLWGQMSDARHQQDKKRKAQVCTGAELPANESRKRQNCHESGGPSGPAPGNIQGMTSSPSRADRDRKPEIFSAGGRKVP